MSENNKMPELTPTDIVQLRDGRYGIVLMNNMASKGLSIFTYDNDNFSCDYYLDDYTDNICMEEHNSDVVRIWKSNIQTQFGLISAFFKQHKTPPYAVPDWTEPKKKMTLREIEKILGHLIEIIDEE